MKKEEAPMRAFRRRFVIYNMLLIGFVLIVSFSALAIFMYRTELRELEKTMSLVVEPWDGENAHGPRPDSENEDKPGDVPPDAEHQPPSGEKPVKKLSREGILTVFYNSETDEISILSSRFSMDESRIRAAVEEIIKREESFGRLKGQNLLYMREGNLNYKIALADTAYITSRMVRNVLLLAAVFVGAMGLFLVISLLLSKLATKPMENALEMERQFVQDLSHDLKTPVTVVLANNSILRLNPDATVREQEQWIASTDDAARSMMELVNQMLTLSQLDSSAESRTKPVLSGINLSQAAEKCVLQMESVAYDRGVELESEIAEGLFAMGEQTSVEKLMNGLIENALKYEPEGGKVSVSLQKSAKNRKKLRFEVRNAGSVIAEEDLPHIFERFYRGDKARSEKGHGLGLPILKRTAELIGAELTVTSGRERGTAFAAVFDAQE